MAPHVQGMSPLCTNVSVWTNGVESTAQCVTKLMEIFSQKTGDVVIYGILYL